MRSTLYRIKSPLDCLFEKKKYEGETKELNRKNIEEIEISPISELYEMLGALKKEQSVC